MFGQRFVGVAVAVAMACSVLLFASNAAAAKPKITGTNPNYFSQQIHVKGSGLVPAGIRSADAPDIINFTKAFIRNGPTCPWRQARVIIPGPRGWSAQQITIAPRVNGKVDEDGEWLSTELWCANSEGKYGFMDLVIQVNGVNSNTHRVRLTKPGSKPFIKKISPTHTVIGAPDSKFSIEIQGWIGESGYAQFQGKRVGTKESTKLTRAIFDIPTSVRKKPGRYRIQLVNPDGYSAIAWWELVAKPDITSVVPSPIPATAILPGVKPLTLKVYFKQSPPTAIYIRAGDGKWKKVAKFRERQGYVEFTSETLVGPYPKNGHISIKIKNRAGIDIRGVALGLKVPGSKPKPKPKMKKLKPKPKPTAKRPP